MNYSFKPLRETNFASKLCSINIRPSPTLKIRLIVSLLILGLGICVQLSAQSFAIEKLLGYEMLTASEGNNIPRFLCSQRSGKATEKKAIFLFIPEDIQHPLFKQTASGYDDVLPFNHRKYLDRFHFVIPVPAQTSLVAEAFDTEALAESPEQNQVFENAHWKYIFQLDQLISYLAQQSWVDPQMMLVAGYKEGGQLAVRVAQRNPIVTHLVALSMLPQDPDGRSFEQEIQDGCPAQYYLSKFMGRSLLAFGTADPYASNYDKFMGSLRFSQKEKIQILPFRDLNASFALIDPWGRDAPESHWKEVARSIMAWTMIP